MAPRFKRYRKDYCQSQLFATNVFDLLPEDHECFLYQELFEQLDTSEVEAWYSHRGQRAYAPRQIVSILIYAYSRGVFSSREIEDKKQISFADPEARIMKQKGDFEYAYNAQISVDGKSQVIVGQHVSQQANDSQEVARALDEVEETSGRLPEKLSLDHGYYSGKNLQEVSDRQVEA